MGNEQIIKQLEGTKIYILHMFYQDDSSIQKLKDAIEGLPIGEMPQNMISKFNRLKHSISGFNKTHGYPSKSNTFQEVKKEALYEIDELIGIIRMR